MKLRAIHSSARLFRRLRALAPSLRESVADAAAEALKGELQRTGSSAILIQPQGVRRSVGSSDLDDIAREFGTLTQIPSPWLAPALPTALEPMRAAAKKAAARAVSNRKRK